MAGKRQAEEAAAAAKPKKRRRRGKAAGAADAADVPPEELARRARQKKLRDLALRLRAEGKVYTAKRRHKPRRRVQLIIVPIVWQKKAAEMGAVMEAAEHVQELLRGMGVKCDTDTTTELTPGQKFRAWEEKGVMLRVELGPREAAEGSCIVARCHNAGEVAEKKEVQVGPRLCELVKRHCAAMGLELSPPAAAAAGGANGCAAATAGGSGEEEERQAPAPAQQQEQGQQQRGGQAGKSMQSAEELEGDFGGLPLLGEQAPGKKGQRKAAGAAVVAAEVAAFKEVLGGSGSGAGGGGEAAGGGSGGKKKAKKGKTVVF